MKYKTNKNFGTGSHILDHSPCCFSANIVIESDATIVVPLMFEAILDRYVISKK